MKDQPFWRVLNLTDVCLVYMFDYHNRENLYIYVGLPQQREFIYMYMLDYHKIENFSTLILIEQMH